MRFAIEKDIPRYIFEGQVVREITVGCEPGKKGILAVSSERGQHGFYFYKVGEPEDLVEQIEKYGYLKRRNIPVPRFFKRCRFADGTSFLLVEDLTEGGRNLVVSANNPEIETEAYKALISGVPEQTKSRIRDRLMYTCQAVVEPLEVPPNPKVMGLKTNAFMLVIKVSDPAKTRFSVADLGDYDVSMAPRYYYQEVLQDNFLSAAVFYDQVLDQPLRVPNNEGITVMTGPLFNSYRALA